MNRSVNILLLLLSIPAMGFVIFMAFDLPLSFLHTTAGTMPQRHAVLIVIAVLLLLLIVRRSVNRWVGVGMTKKPGRYIWSTEMSRERKKNVRLFLLMEAALAAFFALVCWFLTPESWPMVAVYALMFFDQLIFTFATPKWYRVGVTQKAVVIADRELRVLYFSGLRKIDIQQQTIYFDYIEELQLFFPENCIPEGKYGEFREALKTCINPDRVFLSERFKALK